MGGCVVAPYQFCRGTLKSIGAEVNGSGVLVSDIALGDLEIGQSTTVAKLAAAVLTHNSGWEDLDQITFFLAKQTRDSVTQVPRATMEAWKVVLDLADEAPLLSKVSATGFSNVNGYLGMGGGHVLHNEGAAWVHSREKDSGGGAIKIGSQRLVVVSDILEYYMSAAVMKASADSYGGVNTKAVYLNRRTSERRGQAGLDYPERGGGNAKRNPSSSISYGTNSMVEVMGSESGASGSSGGSSTSGSGTSGETTGGETGGTTGGGGGTTDNGGSDNTGGGTGGDNTGGGSGSGDNTGGDDDEVDGTGGDE